MLFFANTWMQQAEERRRAVTVKKIIAETVENGTATPWSEDFKVPERLTIFDGATWKPMSLFDVKPCRHTLPETDEVGVVELSPNRLWAYSEVVLDVGDVLSLKRRESDRRACAFTSQIVIPRLHEYRKTHHWEFWMSYTPWEIMTQRPGLAQARGNVVVAGLGMGWLASRVAARKKVTKLTIVERSQALVDWLWPVILERYIKPVRPDLDVQIVVGDAWAVVPELTADVALWDIWEGWCSRWAERRKVEKLCKNIPRHWLWGTNARPQAMGRM